MKHLPSLLCRLGALLIAALLLTALPAAALSEPSAPPPAAGGDLWTLPEPEVIDLPQPLDLATGESASLPLAAYEADAGQRTGALYERLTAAQQAAYRSFLQAAERVEQAGTAAGLVTLENGRTVSSADAALAVNAVMYDRPDIFWTGGRFAVSRASGDETSVQAVGLASSCTLHSQSELRTARAAYEQAVQRLLSAAALQPDDPPAVQALRLYDALAAHISYDNDAAGGIGDGTAGSIYLPHTAYNALVDGKAVCDGYSKAYIELLERCGIRASMVTSTPLNHGWNLLYLDNGDADPGNDWYESDITWGDTGAAVDHRYFQLTTDAMAALHRGRRNTGGTTGLLPLAAGSTFTFLYTNRLAGNPDPTPTPSVQPTATPRPDYGGGVNGFVNRLYDVCLGREPDTAGFADWTGRLKGGRADGAGVTYGFIFSKEFREKNYCNEHYVSQLYRAFLGREPDDAGLKDWVDRMESGQTREEIFNGFVGSREFTNLCAGYGIVRGNGIAVPQYGTVPKGACAECGKEDGVTSFVKRLYNVCLDRDADTAGLKDWTNRLWEHTASGRDVAEGFIFSREFKAKNYDSATYVEYLYRAFFDREADAAGKADWLNRMAGGWSREQIFDGFVGSQEFDRLCKRYGIMRG